MENLYKAEGIVSMEADKIISEVVEKKITNKDNASPITVSFKYEENKPISINSSEEFEKIKIDILRCFYISIYAKNNSFCIVGDNGSYYVIDTNQVPKDEISQLLIFRKPKKICFDIKEYKEFIRKESSSFWDLKLLFNLLWNFQANDIEDIFEFIDTPLKSKKSIYLYCSNMINIAKELSVYIEKNKLNKSIILESDILLLSIWCEKEGIPVCLDRYADFKENLERRYNSLYSKLHEKYGKDFDFKDKKSIFNHLSKINKLSSIEPNILEKEDINLSNDIKIYNNYNEMISHEIKNDNFIIKYDTYKEHQISWNIAPNSYYLGNVENIIVEGIYHDLYLRTLAELSRNKRLIAATSTNKFLEFINCEILENDKLGVFTEMFIKAYANGIFDSNNIQEYIYSEYDTIINKNDINIINNIFKNKALDLMNFFENFDGSDVSYERYNTKIFQPNTSLDNYIKQIINLILKTSISYIDSSINEYNNKYRRHDDKNIRIVGFYDNKIILASGEKSLSVAIDILNRYMALAYKKYIKNTRYYNTTGTVNKIT